MFAILEPGAHLNPHRDPFGGSLRYHLGLVTPNSDACFIVVDGERYSWRDGEAVMFDETFIHWAENKTPTTRIILFCDVERPLDQQAHDAHQPVRHRELRQDERDAERRRRAGGRAQPLLRAR